METSLGMAIFLTGIALVLWAIPVAYVLISEK